MTTDEKVKKYVIFSNRILSAAKDGNLTQVVNFCKEARIDTHFFAELVKKGYFYVNSRGKKGRWYKSDRVEGFVYQEIESILNDIALRVKTNAINAIPREKKDFPKEELPFRGLSEFTPRELIDELKRRGYTGKLLFTKEIRF